LIYCNLDYVISGDGPAVVDGSDMQLSFGRSVELIHCLGGANFSVRSPCNYGVLGKALRDGENVT